MRYNKFYFYFGADANSWIQNNYVCHYGGVTRKLLDISDNNRTIDKKDIEETIKERLNSIYNFEIIDL